MSKFELEKISLLDYLDIFWRRKWLVIIPTFISIGLAFVVCILTTPTYRASTLVLVERSDIDTIVESRSVALEWQITQGQIETFKDLFLSRPFLTRLAKELYSEQSANASLKTEDRFGNLKTALKIEQLGREGNMLKITGHGQNPVFSAKLANIATELFIKYYLEIKQERTNAGIVFLKEQKELYAKKLAESEQSLRKFKEDNQETLLVGLDLRMDPKLIPQLGTVRTTVSRYLQTKNQLTDLNIQLKEAEKKKEALEKQLSQDFQANSAETIKDPVIQNMQKNLFEKSLELARLEIDLKEAHPRVQKLKDKIEELETGIEERLKLLNTKEWRQLSPVYQGIKVRLFGIEENIDSLKTKIDIFQDLSKEYEELFNTIPEKDQTLSTLQRDHQIDSRIYTDIATKLESALIDQKLESEEKGIRLRIIESAIVPSFPYKPNKKFIVMVGVILGLISGIGLGCFSEVSDTSFKDAEQLEKAFNLPVLGSVGLMYTLEEAEQAIRKHNFFIISVIILFMSLVVWLGLKFFLRIIW